MRILLLGSRGRLGSSIKNFLVKKNVRFIELNKKSLFSKQKNFETYLKLKNKNKIDLIINCTALTNVDLCNKNFNLAYKVNSQILDNIVTSIIHQKIQPLLVHFSTDQIYNSENYKKSNEDSINLSNYYGMSKYLGELKVAQLKKHLIIRTNFFGKSYNKKKITYSDFLIKNLKKKIFKNSSQCIF